MSGGITPVFHRYYDETDQRPAFHLTDEARALGRGHCPYSGDALGMRKTPDAQGSQLVSEGGLEPPRPIKGTSTSS